MSANGRRAATSANPPAAPAPPPPVERWLNGTPAPAGDRTLPAPKRPSAKCTRLRPVVPGTDSPSKNDGRGVGALGRSELQGWWATGTGDGHGLGMWPCAGAGAGGVSGRSVSADSVRSDIWLYPPPAEWAEEEASSARWECDNDEPPDNDADAMSTWDIMARRSTEVCEVRDWDELVSAAAWWWWPA